MNLRPASLAFLPLLPLALALSGCSALKAISVSPGPGVEVLTAIGQSAQFTAVGASQQGSAAPTTSNITSAVNWSVTNPAVATISANGLATAVGAGHTEIQAESGGITASSDLTVTLPAPAAGSSGGVTTSIAIIPGAQSVASPNQSSQFIAIGTSSTGATVNLTNQVSWSSSSTQIATIGVTTGVATAVSQGTTTIAALYTPVAGGSVLAGTATFTVAVGSTEKYTGVSITPVSQALSASGQTGQLIALGTLGSTGLQTDVSSSGQVRWSSNIPSIATVNAAGQVTGVSAGTSIITALLTNPDGSVVSSAASVTVTTTAAPEPLLSLIIIPNTITVGELQDTGQFLAIGTFSSPPTVRDLTNSPTLTWISSAPNIFPVNSNSAGSPGSSAGTVTARGSGGTIVIAEATASDGTIQTATANFNCPYILPDPPRTPGSCFPGSQTPALLATLTVYNEGLNTNGWLVTAPSATGTPGVIHCGPKSASGGSVCEATYPIGSTVTLTAPAGLGAAFGGWSYNCTPLAPVTATGPNSCAVTLKTNDTVGAIFN